MDNTQEKIINGLDISKLKPRRVFLRNEKYECQGTIVVCIETTCSYTNDHFKAVYVGDTGRYSGNKPIYMFGSPFNCVCSNYEPFSGNINL